MNVQTMGAMKRQPLLHIGGRANPAATTTARRSSILSGHELRRIVAAMID